jgi:hypothetical protein
MAVNLPGYIAQTPGGAVDKVETAQDVLTGG